MSMPRTSASAPPRNSAYSIAGPAKGSSASPARPASTQRPLPQTARGSAPGSPPRPPRPDAPASARVIGGIPRDSPYAPVGGLQSRPASGAIFPSLAQSRTNSAAPQRPATSSGAAVNRGHDGPAAERVDFASTAKASTTSMTGLSKFAVPGSTSAAAGMHGQQHPLFTRSKDERRLQSPVPSSDADWAERTEVLAGVTPPMMHRSPIEAQLEMSTGGGARSLVNALRHAHSLLELRATIASGVDFSEEEREEMARLHRLLGKHAPANSRRRSLSFHQSPGSAVPGDSPAISHIDMTPKNSMPIPAALLQTASAPMVPMQPLGAPSADPDIESPAAQPTADPHPPTSTPGTSARRPRPHPHGQASEERHRASHHVVTMADGGSQPRESRQLARRRSSSTHANTGVSWRAAALLHALTSRVAATPIIDAAPEIESITRRFVLPCDIRVGVVDGSGVSFVTAGSGHSAISSQLSADAAAAVASHTALSSEAHTVFPLLAGGSAVGVLACIAPEGKTLDVCDVDDDAAPDAQSASAPVNENVLGVAVSFTAHAVAVGRSLEMSQQRALTLAALAGAMRTPSKVATETTLSQLRDLVCAEHVNVFDVKGAYLLLRPAAAHSESIDALAPDVQHRFPISDPADVGAKSSDGRWPGSAAVLAVASGKRVHLSNAAEAQRANAAFDSISHTNTREVIAVPVRRGSVVVAVVQVVNKEPLASGGSMRTQRFSEADAEAIETFANLLASASSAAATETRASEATQRARRLHAAIAAMRGYAAAVERASRDAAAHGDHRGSSKGASHEVSAAIAAGGRSLLPHTSAVALYFVTGQSRGAPELLRWDIDGQFTRMPASTGIASRTAALGRTQCVDVRNAQYGEFAPAVDLPMGAIDAVSVLSVPLFDSAHKDGERRVVAVLQFTISQHSTLDTVHVYGSGDATTAEAFAEAAALFLAPAVAAASSGPMAFSAAAFEPSVQRIRAVPSSHPALANLLSGDFDVTRLLQLEPRGYAEDVCAKAAVTVLQATGLPQQYGCDEDTLTRFVLACRSKYQDTPYHNWFHAVDVCQTLHTFLYQGGTAPLLQPQECYGLLVACLAHDADHTGMNNGYHLKLKTPLGIFTEVAHSTSVLECHHADVLATILMHDGFNVFSGMSAALRTDATTFAMRAILATDAAKHGEVFGRVKKLLTDGYQQADVDDRTTFASALLHAADVSNPSKPFAICKFWAERVVEEFSRQGDAEKAAGFEIPPMFDRELNGSLPKGQVGFIGFMVEPLFDELADIAPGLAFARDRVQSNKAKWQELAAGPDGQC